MFRNAALLGVCMGAIAVLAGTPRCEGTSIATESFNEAPGDLNGKSGGTGWAIGSSWAASTSIENIVTVASPLHYDIPGWSMNGGGQALQVAGGAANALISRTLSGTVSGEVWISFLLRWTDGSVDNNDFLAFWFDNNNNSSVDHSTVPNIGVKANEGAGPASKEDVVVRLKLGTNDDYAGSLAVDTAATHLIVGRLSKTGGSSKYNSFQMWVDPTSANRVGDTNASNFVYAIDNTGGTTLASFTTIGLRSATLAGTDKILLDELSIGSTMGDVLGSPVNAPLTLVPEPLTMVALTMGLMGLGGYLRRRVGV